MNVTARALADRAAVAVLALALCGTATCSLAQSGTPDKPTVRVVVQSLMQATLSAEIAARITRMPFRDGDAFRKGDVLVAFDCDIFEAQRDKVEAELKAAQAKLDNDRQLAATRSIGALEVILSEVSLQRAQAELRMARINTDRCVISAPWSGRVVTRKAQELEVAKLHQEVLSIVSTEAMEVMAVVPAQWLRSMKPGQMFDLRIDETGSRHSAQIVAVGSQVDAVSQTINVRARIAADPKLLPGMTGDAQLR
ncbi:MAG: efflux RND transporter periplasmic adaptor subunit [Burkholderiaceae bacterium]